MPATLDRLTRTLDTGTRSVEVPIDAFGRERWRAKLDARSIERRAESDEVAFAGHAAVFNKRTWIGGRSWGFWEQVATGAFSKTLKEADVRFLINHNPDLLLARNVAGTLMLDEDDFGLATAATIDTRQSYASDIVISLDRGDVSQMSFAFEVVRDEWEVLDSGKELRTVHECVLYDVSVVTYPAYEDTDAGLRGAAFDVICRSAGVSDADRSRLLRGLNAEEPDSDLVPILRAAGQRLATVDENPAPAETTRDESQPAETTGAPVGLLKRQLDLKAKTHGLTA